LLSGLSDLPFQPPNLGSQIVQSQEQRVYSARLSLPTALPAVNQQAQIARGVVLLAAQPKQLDLQFPLIERCLGSPADVLQLVIQAIEQSRPGHGYLR